MGKLIASSKSGVLRKVLQGMSGKGFSLGAPGNLGSPVAHLLVSIAFSSTRPQEQVGQGGKTPMPRTGGRGGGDQFCQKAPGTPALRVCLCAWGGAGTGDLCFTSSVSERIRLTAWADLALTPFDYLPSAKVTRLTTYYHLISTLAAFGSLLFSVSKLLSLPRYSLEPHETQK